MSRSRRISLVAALALGGCMRIYPDPELPDLEVTWYEGDCNGREEVVLTLRGRDDDSRFEATARCSDGRYTFVDVPRVRYEVEGSVLTTDGVVSSGATAEADLRNGISQEVYLYFGPGGGVRVAWVFAMGASCQSLNAEIVGLVFRPGPYTDIAACESMQSFSSRGNSGTHTLVLHAVRGQTTVAVSDAVEITLSPVVTDVGTLTLTPCGAACPQL